jgi:endonuclease III
MRVFDATSYYRIHAMRSKMLSMAATKWPDSRLGSILDRLERHYGRPAQPPCNGPFEMILWEVVAYLADDTRRGMAFDALRKQVGLTPAKILAAPKKLLCEITRMGGSIAAEERAERLQAAAQLTLDQFGGDLASVLKLPPQKAKKLLMQFPMTGEPGAEKILMFSDALGVLALESNGLRVLVRLGFGEERKSYSATYKSVREVTLEELPADYKLLTKAHLLLRQHGQRLCLRNGPVCHACPVRSDCPFFRSGA